MAENQAPATACPYCGTGSRIHPVGKEACSRAEWEPISTAPQTGQTILAHGPHVEPYTAYYDWVQESWCDRAFGDRCEPEYWMPLPAHPTDKTIRGKLKDS